MDTPENREKAAEILERMDPEGGKRYTEDLQLYAWPQTFASTAGPRGGIGGQMMTTYTVYVFVDVYYHAVATCCGVWKFIDRDDFKPLAPVKF